MSQCKVQNDASLHLVGRMRSTEHPQAWQLMNEVVSLIFYMYKNNPPSPPPKTLPHKTVKSMLVEFLVKTPTDQDKDKAPGYLQIFNSSSTPAALVMLYMSSHKPNRDAAEDAIKHFLNSSKTILAKDTYHECAPIVLEFCRLLSRAAGIDDSLYIFCRSRLGTMVEYIEIGKEKGLIGLRDVFPFVGELAAKISHDLVLNIEATSLLGLSSRDVSDFSAFLVPLKNEIKGDGGCCGTIRVSSPEELCSRQLCADEVIFLRKIFVGLLGKLEDVLVKIEEQVVTKQDNQTLTFGCCEYLELLKELNSISKLYYGCEEVFWETMKRAKGALCYIIVKYAKRSDDNKWILDRKEVTNFEARRHLAMMMLPEVKDDYEELHEMLIDRSHLLAESFEYIAHADAESLRAGLFMEFKNEEATGPGVLREWFFLVCRAIFNPENALFVACPNDRRRFFPNPGVN